MNKYEVHIIDKPDLGWDETLLEGETESLTLYQTTYWASRLIDFSGFRPLYLSVCRSGKLLLKLLLFSCSPFHLKGPRNRLKHTALSLLSGRFGTLLWYGEPVSFSGADQAAYFCLAEAVDNYARKERLKLISGEWPIAMGPALPGHWKTRKWASFKVDLTPEPEIISAGFKPAARNKIRKALNDGITVRRIKTIEELKTYYNFAENCAKRYEKTMYGFKDFETMWRYFRPSCIYETFVAEHQENMIAGLSVWGYGASIAELGSFQSERSYQEKLNGPDLIKWQIIQWAHENKLRSFDLAGINPDPKTEKETNIRRFKEKWGGTYYEYLSILP